VDDVRKETRVKKPNALQPSMSDPRCPVRMSSFHPSFLPSIHHACLPAKNEEGHLKASKIPTVFLLFWFFFCFVVVGCVSFLVSMQRRRTSSESQSREKSFCLAVSRNLQHQPSFTPGITLNTGQAASGAEIVWDRHVLQARPGSTEAGRREPCRDSQRRSRPQLLVTAL
jgi:hypothetical protein